MSIKKISSLKEAMRKYFEENGSMIIAGLAFMNGHSVDYKLYRTVK